MKFGGWNGSEIFKEKVCAVCGTAFKPKSGVNKFCSVTCKGKWKYVTGVMATENQYKLISGNWDRYCARLLYYGGRKRDKLSKEILLRQLEKQGYKCALSGVPLTCKLEKGTKYPTNASVDRITPGGPYTADNIQMVCRALNSWRADLTVEEFQWWCQQVVDKARETGG